MIAQVGQSGPALMKYARNNGMRSNPRVGNGSYNPPDDSSESGRHGSITAISARHTLLSDSWTAQVAALEAAIRDFKPDRHWPNTCEVVFFEVPGDEHLHVNVTHRYATKVVSGWAGPGSIPDGFVHSRTFGDTTQSEIIRHIRNIVFAPRV
jgi:hypothetical protein